MKNLFMRACTRPTGTLILRLTLGGIFMYHGFHKLIDMNGTIVSFAALGIPAILAWIVAIIQGIGGLLVVIGIRVRTIAILLAGIMLYTILFIKNGKGFSAMELNVVLFGLSLGVATLGCGKYSVCSMQHGDCKECENHKGTCGCECKDKKNKTEEVK
jgi:uncharacterized membrane protein YphA (DoxX/SURF4 family)